MEFDFSNIKEELSSNFIEYAYEVNSDRAIPDARSGLKPVARRIIWDMYDTKISSGKPHVKCARVVGSVMGSWHPHGDSSIYGALVRLSQPWILRYPLIDFHGNQGNQAGDGPASMRYTECRLSKITEKGMLEGLKKNNVDMALNYDDTRKEPVTLPAIFPNLLCNPNTGIGVAMAASWLPHNLNEVAQAIFDYMDGKDPMLPGPDFPTGGIVINKNDIPSIMKSGHGSIRIRGKYKIEKQNIVFYEIPYGTSTEALLDEIGEVCEKKDVEGVSEVRDESNKKGLRLVIICEKTANPENVVKKLFAKTNLQSSISYNQVALVNKTPTELNLKDCIEIYINHNIDCLKKELAFDIEKAKARLHIVEGLLIALANIDEVIAIIKKSESQAAACTNLENRFKLSSIQSKAVVDTKLGRLTRLEVQDLEEEKKSLLIKIAELELHLNSRELQESDIRTRLQELVSKFGDARRTELVQIEVSKEEKEVEEVEPEDVVVILTQTGDIKRIPKASFKAQRKGGKGVKNKDDAVLTSISTNTIDKLMLFTSKGKMYQLLVDNIPTGTNTSKGTNINNLINIGTDEKIEAATSLYHKTDAKYVVFFTKRGLIKKTSLEEYTKVKRGSGIAAINIKDGDSLANVTFLADEDVILITKGGNSIHFSMSEVSAIGRVTAGVKSIRLDKDDEVLIGLPVHKNTDYLAVFTEKGFAKKCNLDDLPLQMRGGKGVAIYKPSSATGKLIGAAMISDEDNILLVGKPNSICIKTTDIPLLTRISMGNIMMKGDVVSAVKL